MLSDPFSLIRADWPDPLSHDAHLRRLGALFDEIYEYYRTPLHPHQRQMYAEDLAHIAFDEAYWAFRHYRRMPPPANQTKKPPMPQDILDLIDPPKRPIDEANEIAASIWSAVASLGNNKSAAQVKAHIGDKAWQVVIYGGGTWREICERALIKEAANFHAQTRDKAMAVICAWQHAQKKAELCAIRQKRQLKEMPEHQRRNGGLSSVGHLLASVHQAQQASHDR